MIPPRPKMKRILCFVLVLLCVSCHKQGEAPADKTLSVALYPYLQNMDEAKRMITEIWDGRNTGWTLEFDDWNCYHDSPGTDVDVFCIDCLYEQYYKNEGMISAISRTSIIDPDDFYDCFNLSGECNGIPFLLCQDFLIYPERDRRMTDAVNARDLLDYAGPGRMLFQRTDENFCHTLQGFLKGFNIRGNIGAAVMVRYENLRADGFYHIRALFH